MDRLHWDGMIVHDLCVGANRLSSTARRVQVIWEDWKGIRGHIRVVIFALRRHPNCHIMLLNEYMRS